MNVKWCVSIRGLGSGRVCYSCERVECEVLEQMKSSCTFSIWNRSVIIWLHAYCPGGNLSLLCPPYFLGQYFLNYTFLFKHFNTSWQIVTSYSTITYALSVVVYLCFDLFKLFLKIDFLIYCTPYNFFPHNLYHFKIIKRNITSVYKTFNFIISCFFIRCCLVYSI